MAEDKQVKKYFENIPHGKDAKPSEIHGKHNKQTIDKMVTDLVKLYDKSKADGDKAMASNYSDAIRKIALDCENLQIPKEEFAMLYGSGVGGASQFSNYTDLSWERKFMTENGTIGFSPKDMSMVLSVEDQDGNLISKGIQDITQDWVVKGTEEGDYMKMQQDAQKQSNTIGEPLNFDADWHVSNLLAKSDTWKSFVSDKIGGRYFLHDYLQENQDKIKSGELTDEMLHPDSFNPDFDTRLHQYYSNRIKKSFDPNHQTAKERMAADELIAKSNNQNNQA